MSLLHRVIDAVESGLIEREEPPTHDQEEGDTNEEEHQIEDREMVIGLKMTKAKRRWHFGSGNELEEEYHNHHHNSDPHETFHIAEYDVGTSEEPLAAVVGTSGWNNPTGEAVETTSDTFNIRPATDSKGKVNREEVEYSKLLDTWEEHYKIVVECRVSNVYGITEWEREPLAVEEIEEEEYEELNDKE